ncbi:MAG: hypothetical protein DRN33_03405 [Thermoplasmata archaeon]|nr:MAG: hypothetical protein DRN33_03405 [Thermoplasmata archaeon]
MNGEMNHEEILQKEYFPYVHRIGRIFCTLLFIANVLPVGLVFLLYGVGPDMKAALTALGMAAMILLPFYLTEGWMYFPVLGIAGNYMQWAGNTSNCRVPCAAVALEVLDVKEGTPESEIIGNIAVGTSIVVNAAFVLVGSLIGALLMTVLPVSVKGAFALALPAIFGAIYAQFLLRGPVYAVAVLVLALLLHGLTDLPNWGVMLVLMVIMLTASILLYKWGGKFYLKEEKEK